MKRTAIQRRTPLRPKAPPPRHARQWEGEAPKVAPARATLRSDTRARMVVPVPKDNPIEHESYRRLVAARPCIACGITGISQAAHGPTLGKSIKADDRSCVPLCADQPGRKGCHGLVDRYVMFNRDQRTEVMASWARRTQEAIVSEGLWPDGLERPDVPMSRARDTTAEARNAVAPRLDGRVKPL